MTDIYTIVCEVENLLKEADHHATYAADGYDAGWYNGEGNAYETVLEILQKAGYRKRTRKFFDIETREIITEEVLAETLEELRECDPDTYGDITLGQYINNCLTINNGTLEEV